MSAGRPHGHMATVTHQRGPKQVTGTPSPQAKQHPPNKPYSLRSAARHGQLAGLWLRLLRQPSSLNARTGRRGLLDKPMDSAELEELRRGGHGAVGSQCTPTAATQFGGHRAGLRSTPSGTGRRDGPPGFGARIKSRVPRRVTWWHPGRVLVSQLVYRRHMGGAHSAPSRPHGRPRWSATGKWIEFAEVKRVPRWASRPRTRRTLVLSFFDDEGRRVGGGGARFVAHGRQLHFSTRRSARTSSASAQRAPRGSSGRAGWSAGDFVTGEGDAAAGSYTWATDHGSGPITSDRAKSACKNPQAPRTGTALGRLDDHRRGVLLGGGPDADALGAAGPGATGARSPDRTSPAWLTAFREGRRGARLSRWKREGDQEASGTRTAELPSDGRAGRWDGRGARARLRGSGSEETHGALVGRAPYQAAGVDDLRCADSFAGGHFAFALGDGTEACPTSRPGGARWRWPNCLTDASVPSGQLER